MEVHVMNNNNYVEMWTIGLHVGLVTTQSEAYRCCHSFLSTGWFQELIRK